MAKVGLDVVGATPTNNNGLRNPAESSGAESGAVGAGLPPDVLNLARRLLALPPDQWQALVDLLNSNGAQPPKVLNPEA